MFTVINQHLGTTAVERYVTGSTKKGTFNTAGVACTAYANGMEFQVPCQNGNTNGKLRCNSGVIELYQPPNAPGMCFRKNLSPPFPQCNLYACGRIPAG